MWWAQKRHSFLRVAIGFSLLAILKEMIIKTDSKKSIGVLVLANQPQTRTVEGSL